MATPETYEQSLKRRQQSKQLEIQALSSLNLEKDLVKTLSQATPPIVNTGVQKLNELIVSKVLQFSSQALPSLYALGDQLGISDITSPNPKIPDLCPDSTTLERVYTVRNNIVQQLNIISKYLTVTQKSLNILSDLLNGQINIVKALALIRTTTSLGAKAITPLPGPVASILSDVESLRLTLTFDIQGNPRLEKVKQTVSQGEQYLTQVSVVLSKILQVIQVIDTLLLKCQKNPLDSLSEDVQSITALGNQPVTATNQLYRGFILDIETKPFSPTVIQTRATGRNSQGIILLTTPYSFTTKPELLISELKFKIDSENLKPY
jgi:hypothetical protein